MKTANQNPNLTRAARTLQTVLLSTALTAAAAAQQTIGSRPYGQPSECAPGSPAELALSLANVKGEAPALRLEGGVPGAPAFVLLGGQATETKLPGGGTILVGSLTTVMPGSFDHHGVCTYSLSNVRFESADVALFAQGMQPMSGSTGTELSGGLRLAPETPECLPVETAPQAPENVLVEEFANLLRGKHLESALSVALNSKGDQLVLDISGNLEVPVWPGITAGGKAAVKASIQRGEDSVGNVIYDVVIAADVAASAGVGAGAAGAGISAGHGGELVWRYKSTHEVARALRSMAILQAVSDRLEAVCLALDTQIENMDRAIGFARDTADRARDAVRSRMPWRNNAIVQKLHEKVDSARAARRAAADRARKAVARLIGWVAGERVFLTLHLHGFELHSTTAIEVNIGTGFGDSKKNGQVSGANFGASAAAGLERQYGLRVERVEESEAMFVQHKIAFTKQLAASAGCVIGGSVAAKRVIEITSKLQVGKDGVQLADCGTTVKLALDGRLLVAIGAFIAGQAGVGGEVSVEMQMKDLLAYGSDAMAILTGDDDGKIVALLRALPIKIEGRGRYEAGIAIGFSIDLDGVFKGGFACSAMMIDRGTGFEYQGGRDDASQDSSKAQRLLETAVESRGDGPVQRMKQAFESRLGAVKDEVSRVMQPR